MRLFGHVNCDSVNAKWSDVMNVKGWHFIASGVIVHRCVARFILMCRLFLTSFFRASDVPLLNTIFAYFVHKILWYFPVYVRY